MLEGFYGSNSMWLIIGFTLGYVFHWVLSLFSHKHTKENDK